MVDDNFNFKDSTRAMTVGWPSATTRVPERGICKAPVGTHLAAMAQVMGYGPTKCSCKLPP